MNEQNEMTEIEKIAAELELRVLESNGPPVPDHLMEAFLEGRLEGEEKQKVMEQILASPESLSLLKMTMAMEDLPLQDARGEQPTRSARIIPFYRRFQPLTALAAVFILAIGLFLIKPEPPPPDSGSFALTSDVRQLLLDNEQWSGGQGLETWLAALQAADVDINSSQLQRVVLEEEYFVPKSLDAPEEEVVFRFRDGVLFVTIREKDPGDE